jgi:hypothetical protein
MKTILAIALLVAMFAIPSALANGIELPSENFPYGETPLVNGAAFADSIPGSLLWGYGFPGFSYDGFFCAANGGDSQGLSWVAFGKKPLLT